MSTKDATWPSWLAGELACKLLESLPGDVQSAVKARRQQVAQRRREREAKRLEDAAKVESDKTSAEFLKAVALKTRHFGDPPAMVRMHHPALDVRQVFSVNAAPIWARSGWIVEEIVST